MNDEITEKFTNLEKIFSSIFSHEKMIRSVGAGNIFSKVALEELK